MVFLRDEEQWGIFYKNLITPPVNNEYLQVIHTKNLNFDPYHAYLQFLHYYKLGDKSYDKFSSSRQPYSRNLTNPIIELLPFKKYIYIIITVVFTSIHIV